MEMWERVKAIRDSEDLGRTLWGRKIGVSKKTLDGIEQKGSTPNGDTLAAICSNYPQYTLWLMTGQTDPAAGQISPMMEEQRRAANSRTE